MTDNQRTNNGALFRNERKERANQPDHNGSADIQCPHCNNVTSYWLAAWVKQAASTGKKYFSLSFTKKEPK